MKLYFSIGKINLLTIRLGLSYPGCSPSISELSISVGLSNVAIFNTADVLFGMICISPKFYRDSSRIRLG
jgi:hypothetical protein